MKTFQGKTRQFQIELTIGAARRIKSACGVDLLNPAAVRDGVPLFTQLYTDIVLFVDVLYVLCVPDGSMADEEFANELPATWIECRDAFFAEWVDFFHRNGLRDKKTQLVKALEAVVEGLKVTEERLMQVDVAGKTREAVEAMNFDEMIEANLQKTPGSKSTGSPVLSASTPTN